MRCDERCSAVRFAQVALFPADLFLMRKLLLGLSIGIAALLVGGTTVALVGIAVVAPVAALLLALRSAGRRDRKSPGKTGAFSVAGL